jgi:hypothetical protein
VLAEFADLRRAEHRLEGARPFEHYFLVLLVLVRLPKEAARY